MPQEEYPQYFTDLRYSDHSDLNTLRVCLPQPPSSTDRSKVWLIYIHGGAWRDPDILASSFDKLQHSLLTHSIAPQLQGIASIDYRLSSYPSHSSNPSDPNDPARNAKHPEHIEDVLHAILYLQEKYNFQERYVLVGHSCGATLALQVAMRRFWGEQYKSAFADELNVVPPLAIVGVDGIYDLPALIEEYLDIPAYLHLVTNAFGSSRQSWKEASPTSGLYHTSWSDGTLLCLVHSDADELLSGRQRQIMLSKMETSEWSMLDGHAVSTYDIHGLKHDEVWQQPNQLTDILAVVIRTVASRA